MTAISQADNFYSFRCEKCEDRKVHYAACQMKLTRISCGEEFASQKWPECAGGSCRASKMMTEEMGTGMSIYYLDRDDAGVGIVSRQDLGRPPRTPEERMFHHHITSMLGVRIDEEKETATPVLKPKVEGIRRPTTKAPIPAATTSIPAGAFDLGGLINEAVGAM